ncbi:MAG: ribonuclease HI family protein [Planctomycetes bacterium]|nr:ribonuclease HI family protein [Planctomycetota bacterium]
MGLIVHVDGGSRGNPGPAGAGVTISSDDGTLIHEGAYFLGRQTNNGAEYHALIRALQRVERCGADTITVFSDSELLVRQITGAYRVKSLKLARLFEQVQLLLLKIPCWNIRHIHREENGRADELANLAIDRHADVIVFDADPAAGATADRHAKPETAGEQAGGGTPTPATPDTTTARADVVRAARVTLARAPKTGACPAGSCSPDSFTVEHTLPKGLCIHAAHALVPTILAVLNTEPAEFAAVPTLTVRCMNPECGATFHVSPTPGSNGSAKRDG